MSKIRDEINQQKVSLSGNFFEKELEFKIWQFIDIYVKYKIKAVEQSTFNEEQIFYEVKEFEAIAYINKKDVQEFNRRFGDEAHHNYLLGVRKWSARGNTEVKVLKEIKKAVFKTMKYALVKKEQFGSSIFKQPTIYDIENFLQHYLGFYNLYHEEYNSDTELTLMRADLISAEELKFQLGIHVEYADNVKKTFFMYNSSLLDNVNKIVREMAQIIHSSIVKSEE